MAVRLFATGNVYGVVLDRGGVETRRGTQPEKLLECWSDAASMEGKEALPAVLI